MSLDTAQDYRETSYCAITPFRILFHPSISVNELKLYGLIAQMEYSTGNVFFTNAKLAKILEVNERNLIKISQKLQEKGYIIREYKEVNIKGRKQYMHTWSTVKATILNQEEVNNYTGGVSQRQGGGVSQGHPCKHTISKHKISNIIPPISPITPEPDLSKELAPTRSRSLPQGAGREKTAKSKSVALTLDDLIACNPLSIPEYMLRDFVENRRKYPLTETAWVQINRELMKFRDAGLDPIEQFSQMVTNNWRSISFNKHQQFTKTDHTNALNWRK